MTKDEILTGAAEGVNVKAKMPSFHQLLDNYAEKLKPDVTINGVRSTQNEQGFMDLMNKRPKVK